MKRKQAKKKLKSAMARVCDVETVIGNLSLRLKKLEEVPVATVDSIAGNWATAVEKFRELEGRIQAHERKIEWLNNHQNAGDQAVSNLREILAGRERKMEAFNKKLIRLEEKITPVVEKPLGKPLVEVFAKEKKA
jgi:chromosome segregation ATPase